MIRFLYVKEEQIHKMFQVTKNDIKCVSLIMWFVDRGPACDVFVENSGHWQLAYFLKLDHDFDSLVRNILYF
jgi:hypothetical protein